MNDSNALPPFGPLPEDLTILGLPANALLLLDKLRFFYCRSRRCCWPSDDDLSRRTGLSVHQVRRGLRRLERHGLIRRQTTARRLDDGRLRRRRFIDLLFTEPGAGAQTDRAPAPIGRQAPAPNQEVVVVEGRENSKSPDLDRRERRPEPSSALLRPEAGVPIQVTWKAPEVLQEARRAAPNPGQAEPPPEPATATPIAKRPGEAMERVFAKLGADMPTLTPSLPPLPTPELAPQAPPRSPASARSRPVLTTEALEALAAGGDPIIQGELSRRRAAEARRADAAAIPPPATTAELLGRIRESAAYVSQAAQVLAVELGDERSWRGLHALCRRAFEGELDPAALVYALGKARGPRVRKPGAIFTVEVGRWRGP